MSFKLPDLIIESVIRDGLNNARRDETVIDDVFADLEKAFASKKYGTKEINKIKNILKNKELSIVHSYSAVQSSLPCISIQLADDREETEKAHMGNYVKPQVRKFTTPEELAALVVVTGITPDSYDQMTGTVKVPDSVNLAPVHVNLLYVDSDGNTFPIVGGINNEPGEKQFLVAKGSELAPGAGGEIKSSIDYEQFQRHGNIETAQLILGVHTAEPLLTKYMYILLKYILLSRKKDMISRGLQLNTYIGSDFTRDMDYGADMVFTRFVNVSGMVQNQWRADKVQLLDNVDVKVTVPKDRAGNEELKRTDQTIKVKE